MRAANPTTWGLGTGLVEDMNRRTQHSMRFRNSNGSFTEVLSSNLHYLARPGEWEPQNLNFRLKGAYHDADRHWFRTRVSDAGIEVLDKATGVGLRWLTPVRPSATGRLTQLTRDGVSWTWSVGPRRLKLQGLVTSTLGHRTHSFQYQPLGAGQDFQIVNGAAVSPGVAIGAPVIIGADRTLYPTSGWTSAPGPKLEFTFDDSGLPPEAYPYIIDPTTTLQPGSGGFDALIIDGGSATTNFGSGGTLQSGDGKPSGDSKQRSLIKFDVSSIPSVDIVSSAILSLFESNAVDDVPVGSTAVNLQRLRRDWVEAEATWNIWKTSNNWTAAGAASTADDIFSAISDTINLDGTAANAFVSWPGSATMIADVQGFVDGGLSNFGWRIQSPDKEDQGANEVINVFKSSDDATATDRPKLVVIHAALFTPKVIII